MDEFKETKELLVRVLSKLDELEGRLSSIEDEVKTIEVYRSLLRTYAHVLGIIVSVEKVAELVVGELERSIVRILAKKGPLNISQIAEELRKMRGKASRRIISQKLKKLEAQGLVERIEGRGKVYRIARKYSSRPEEETLNSQ